MSDGNDVLVERVPEERIGVNETEELLDVLYTSCELEKKAFLHYHHHYYHRRRLPFFSSIFYFAYFSALSRENVFEN